MGGIIAIVFSILFLWAAFNIQYSPFTVGIPFLLMGGLLSLSFGVKIHMIIRKDKMAKKQVDQSN